MKSEEKKKLLDKLERAGYIATPLVRHAMSVVPREEFVPDHAREDAYQDRPLPIGNGQTISAPHMNAMMCSGLELDGDDPILLLEIGTGSGYHATLCAEMLKERNPGSHVYTVERIPALAAQARTKIEKLGYGDIITVVAGDGTLGLPEHAPYDRILVTAAGPRVPAALEEQLAEGGLMLIPIGASGHYQSLVKIRKKHDELVQDEICGVAFVPLIGEDGFKA